MRDLGSIGSVWDVRVLRWVGANLGLFAATLLVVLLVTGLIDQATGGEPPGVVGRTVFAWAIILGALLPGIGLYLLAVAFLPGSWTALRRRLVAVALGPIVFLIPWIEAVPRGDLGDLVALAVMSLIPGAVVRLPRGASGRRDTHGSPLAR